MRATTLLRLVIAMTLAPGCAGELELMPDLYLEDPAPIAATSRKDGCQVRGARDPSETSPFLIYARRTASSPVALIRNPESTALHFSSFPTFEEKVDDGAPPRASVNFDDEGISISGWVDLPARRFVMRRRRELLPGRVWVEPSTPIQLWGMRGENLVASAKAPFGEPSRTTFLLSCDDVAYDARSSLPTIPNQLAERRVWPSGSSIRFFEKPGAGAGFTVRPTPDTLLFATRHAGGHSLVRARSLRQSGDAYEAAIIEGWVPDADLGPAPEEPEPTPTVYREPQPVTHPTCPAVRTKARAELRVGHPNGAIIGELEEGAQVWVVDQRGDRIAVVPVLQRIAPPPGVHWWIALDAIGGVCKPERNARCSSCTP